MKTQTISTKELRENFERVKNAMARGESLLLLYRSKPLARIEPVQHTEELDSEEHLKEIRRLAGKVSSGAHLSIDDLNGLIDEQHDDLLS